jgi:hypothetical protein
MAANLHPISIVALLILLLPGGCDSHDERLAQLAAHHAALQSRQHEETAALHREVASGSRQLVEAQAASTDKLLAMQGELQRQYTELEQERRSLAVERARESLLAPLVSGLGAILLALLPLLVCVRLLRQWRDEPLETELSGLLLEELLESGVHPPALPPGPADPRALATPADGDADGSDDYDE